MKDILVVVSPSTGVHQSACKSMKMEAEKFDKTLQQSFESAFLLSGPKAFETAMSLYHIAEHSNLPIAMFEIEAVLIPLEDAHKV